MPRRAPTLAANGGPGELLNQHHPQQPLLPLYHITLFLSCPLLWQGGKVRATFSVAVVQTDNDPPSPPIL